MIKKWHKGRTSVGDNNLASIEEVKERLDYFRSFSKKGIENLTDVEIAQLKTEITEYFSDWGYFVNKLPKDRDYFRVTVNKRITQQNNHPLTKISQLTGPPKKFLKTIGRCNGLEIPVFYCADSLKAAVMEANPEIGDAITVTMWHLRDKQVVYYGHIFHPDVTAPVSNNKILFKEFMTARKRSSNKLAQITSENLRFLTEEFIKPVESTEASNYLFSSLFSEITFKQMVGKERVRAIMYPSTKIQNGQSNIAFADAIVHEIFELVEIRAGFVNNIWETPEITYRKIDLDIELPFVCHDFDVLQDRIGDFERVIES